MVSDRRKKLYCKEVRFNEYLVVGRLKSFIILVKVKNTKLTKYILRSFFLVGIEKDRCSANQLKKTNQFQKVVGSNKSLLRVKETFFFSFLYKKWIN